MIIVGARCAGASTAMLLARAGASVLVVERGKEGTDTLSTHALMRPGVLQLHFWGVLPAVIERGTPVVRSTSFHYGAGDVVTVQLKPRDGVEGLYAPRRFLLDQLLVDAARAAGVEFAHGLVVVDLVRDRDGRVTGVVARPSDGAAGSEIELAADIVVGADGMRSSVAKLVGAAAYRTGAYTTSTVFNYFEGLGLDGYHWYYGSGVATGVIPSNDGRTCVFTAMPPSRFEAMSHDIAAAHASALRECSSEFFDRVAGATAPERYRGFAGQFGYIRQSWGPGWALVGDACYFKDPLTAHGQTDALIDAEYVARAILAGNDAAFAACQHQRDERVIKLFEVTDEIASFTWDRTRLQQLHLQLSEEMKREANAVLELHAAARGV